LNQTGISGRAEGPRGLRNVGEAELVRDGGGLAAIGDAEFGEDVGYVHACCAVADVERFGDLVVGSSIGEQREYLSLTFGELELLCCVWEVVLGVIGLDR
jgi:hypothetical protein